jgi:single-strand DNA-binding protein
VEGSLRTRKWKDKEGNDQYTTEIRAAELKMLGSPSRGAEQTGNGHGHGGASAQQQPRAQNNAHQASNQWDDDDDIPF